jgi:hypothetical protein
MPGWEFQVTERSIGVYEVKAMDAAGHQVMLEGLDPNELLVRARADAKRIREMLSARRED